MAARPWRGGHELAARRPVAAERLAPGPAWRTAVAYEDEGFETLANNGIDIYTDRVVRDPGENFEAAPCPACGIRLSDDEYTALVEP